MTKNWPMSLLRHLYKLFTSIMKNIKQLLDENQPVE